MKADGFGSMVILSDSELYWSKGRLYNPRIDMWEFAADEVWKDGPLERVDDEG